MVKPLRSQATRDRILAAAKRLFAEQGFEQTTIRAVAGAVGVTPAMVMRYYGSKEDLFATAASVDFHMPDLTALPFAKRGELLVKHILEQWDSGDELPALLRAASTHESARHRLVDAVEMQAKQAFAAVLPDHSEEIIALLEMQIAGMVLSRYVLKQPTVMALSREQMIRTVGAAIQSLLPAPEDTKGRRKQPVRHSRP